MRPHWVLTSVLSVACCLGGAAAEAAVTRTAQASFEVSAYVDSRCTVSTAALGQADMRASTVNCVGVQPAAVLVRAVNALPAPPSVVRQVDAAGARVLVVIY
jgi:hypothetical protein